MGSINPEARDAETEVDVMEKSWSVGQMKSL